MTMWIELGVALGVAAVLTALFALALDWRRPGDLPRAEQRGPLGLLFFALVAAAAWLGGGWLAERDPSWAPTWLSLLLAGLVAALVAVSLVASEQRWRTGAAPSGGATSSAGALALAAEPARVAPGLTALFWGLLVGVVTLAGLLWSIQPAG